ncbi:ATP-binding protein [Brevundimonas sp. AAP58]|uniref:ATP-binding protein n=1 Tax=Brevundimonas sp. AAP58 TaxID=1523422 RepID=UPI0009E77DB1|nr:ATP-binding protein [Brevundimonas sp. AAP58]
MDAIRNPFAPGAGSPPPELAGRTHILNQAEVALGRTQRGRHAKSVMIVGLRGVGKTVLLNRILALADEQGYVAEMIEAPENKSLAALLTPALRALILKLDRGEQANAAAKRAFRVLRGFAAAIRVRYQDIEISLEGEPEPGLADSGDLEADLPDLLIALGEAARERGTAAALIMDELQYLDEIEMSALIVGMHKVAQRQLPLTLFGAGLPQLVGLTGRSKSYAERLFDFPVAGPLSLDDARLALRTPIEDEGADITEPAIRRIHDLTEGYPYFLQEWGYHAWLGAAGPQIGVGDVDQATPEAVAALDRSFFRVRFDRLTPAEKRYLSAMARLGAGPHRSGDIAQELGVKVNSTGPVRASLIQKGMVYSPAHGDTAFTVPLFDQFMARTMP